MSKQIKPEELAEILTRLLINPSAAGELETDISYAAFMRDITEVVCNHCGGEVRDMPAVLDDVWYVGIHGNDSLPESGGVWARYDEEGELFDECDPHQE